jgi:hypothetical protein
MDWKRTAIILLLLLSGLVGLNAYAGSKDRAKPRWEYKAVGFPTAQYENELNLLGAQGWELVTVTEVGGATIYFFKRPR